MEKGWNMPQYVKTPWLRCTLCDEEEVASGWGLVMTKLGENEMLI